MRTGFCLEPSEGPLFGFVARIDPQKGVDALVEAAREVTAGGGQLAILGEGGRSSSAASSISASASAAPSASTSAMPSRSRGACSPPPTSS